MRVATFNIRGFRDGRDLVTQAVRSIEPDVLLLQETGSRRALRRFGSDVGMRVGQDPRSPFRRRVKNAVLARDPWRISSVRLARFAGARRWYPRGALVAQVGSDVGHLWALSVHLGLGGGERAHQVEALIDLVASLAGTPVVLAGDLNATPDKRAVSRLAATLRDAWAEAGEGEGATFPAIAPAARIDYVFVGEGVEIMRASRGVGVASDHIPVVVDLEFAGT